MRLQAYDDNGTMKFRQVSGSQALDSLPVGTTIGYSGSVAPNGYLFCDGSTFDAAKYPELFSKLGTNVLPVCSDPSKPTAKLPINGTGSIQFNLTTTNTAAPYDGIINFGYSVAHVRTIYINDIPRAISGNSEHGNTTQVQVNKGDLVRVQLSLDTAASYNWAIWYTKPMLIKVKTIGIADIEINAVKTALTPSKIEELGNMSGHNSLANAIEMPYSGLLIYRWSTVASSLSSHTLHLVYDDGTETTISMASVNYSADSRTIAVQKGWKIYSSSSESARATASIQKLFI